MILVFTGLFLAILQGLLGGIDNGQAIALDQVCL